MPANQARGSRAARDAPRDEPHDANHDEDHRVQPGVSKAAISEPQLRLLSVTENYLTETYQLPFKAVIKP